MITSPLQRNDQLREVVAAIKAGRKQEARAIVRQLHQREPDNEQVLLWAAALAEDASEAHTYLRRVLEINPNNQQALNTLALSRLAPAAPKPVPKPAAPTPPQAPPAPPPVVAEPPRAAPPPPLPAARPVAVIPPHPPAPAQKPACPVCRSEMAAIDGKRCHYCGSITDLRHLGLLATNRGVNDRVVQEALEYWGKHGAEDGGFEACYGLACGYMNLCRSTDAVAYLKKACAARTGDSELRAALEQILRRRVILAVDDSLTLRRVLSMTLERGGYRVTTAVDGMQALARVGEEVPDLVLLDITMPKMDGYQVCRVMKQNEYTKHVPVIMLSGKDGFFDKVKGKLAGSSDYITKPFDEQQLLKTVAGYMKKARPREAGLERVGVEVG